MRNTLLLWICLFGFSFALTANDDWGKTGHRVTGEIAEAHLTAKAKRAIDKLLNGGSLALISNYADEIKSDTIYRKYSPWHYVNFPFDKTYETHPKSEKGDIIVAINTCISVLKDDSSDRADKVFHLKMLVHLIGDLHQPLHIGLAEDRGGNDFKVQWFDEETNLHVVWDTELIESYKMSYSEMASNRTKLSDAQLEYIQSGTVIDWMNESRELCKNIYSTTKAGDNLSYRYMYAYMDIVRSQLQKGGIRLAVVLNDIFG